MPDLKQTQHTRNRYNLISWVYNLMEWPIEVFWYKKWRKQLWDQVEGPSVLEIGIGTGKNISYYPKNIDVTGVDLSANMLQKARKIVEQNKLDKVHLFEMDAQHLELPEDTFDETVATFAFCSVPDPVQGLKEALRVTKPGGKLYLLEHMLSTSSFLAGIMKKLDKPIHYLLGVHIARQTVENVKKAGWDLQSVQVLTSNGVFRKIEAQKPE